MARIYRDCRVGRLPTSEGSRLVFMLCQVAKVLEAEQLERRLDQLEQRFEDRGDRD